MSYDVYKPLRNLMLLILPYCNYYYYQTVLPKGRFFTKNAGTKIVVLFKGHGRLARSISKELVT